MVLVRFLILNGSRCISTNQPAIARRGLLNQTRFLHASNSNHKFSDRIRDFVFASEKENFDDAFVKRAHKWDNVNEKEWSLIYRDLGASRSFLMMATLFPAFIVGACIIGYDLTQNSRGNRMDFVQRLANDAEELGFLLALPTLSLFIVIILLLRVQQCRLLRIYQNRLNPDEFSAIASKMVLGQRKLPFNRIECSSFYFAEEQTDGMRILLNFVFGNLHIGNRRFLVMDDNFRGNNFRSFMLNETSVPPRMPELSK